MEYKIGDIVYIVSTTSTANIVTCPVCAGTTKLLVKPVHAPDELGSIVLCENCSTSTQTPGTVINDRSIKPVVNKVIIQGIITIETCFGKPTKEYQYNMSGGSYCTLRKDDNVFTDPILAQEVAEKLAEKQTALKLANSAKKISEKCKTASGRILYHQQQLRELDNRAAYHLTQLTIDRSITYAEQGKKLKIKEKKT